MTADIESGKLETAADLLHALYPDGTPLEKQQAAEAQAKAQETADEADQQRKLLAQKFDLGAVDGAMGAFMQARLKRNPAGLATFFYAKDDPTHLVAKANAQRILTELDLEDAAKKTFGDKGGQFLSGSLSKESDLPVWFENPIVKGDTATAQSEGAPKMLFHKVDGVWKEDLSLPASPQSRAQAMEDDTAKAKVFIADLLAGKYKTAEAASAALTNLHLYPGANGGIIDK